MLIFDGVSDRKIKRRAFKELAWRTMIVRRLGPTLDEIVRAGWSTSNPAMRFEPGVRSQVRSWALGSTIAHVGANRHDVARWLKAFMPILSVANDAMLDGDRAKAIRVLCEMVELDDAIDITTSQVTFKTDRFDAAELAFLKRQLETIDATDYMRAVL